MKHDKAFVVLDLETTGTWLEKDRIIEIAMIKCLCDQSRETYHRRVNPGIPIPPEVSQLVGIKDVDVQEEPPFKDLAKEVVQFIGDAEFAGFNIERFDLPLLKRELKEAGCDFNWQDKKIFDAQKVYHLNEKRDLTAAYKYYCQKELLKAHSAMADTEATLEVLKAQVDRYGKGDDELDHLAAFEYKSLAEYYDEDRKFRWWNGKLYMMFGKYAKKYSLQEVAKKDRDYCGWILSANFNQDVKDLVTDALDGQFPKFKAKDQMELF